MDFEIYTRSIIGKKLLDLFEIKSQYPIWYYLSYNPNITWDIIQDNPDKP